MGNLGGMRPRASKRDFSEPRARKVALRRKSGQRLNFVRGSYRPGSVRDSLHSARSASLRTEQTELPNQRGGNDARRKAWKTQTPSFPPFPPRLEIRQKPRDFHLSPASATGSLPSLSRAHPWNRLADADQLAKDPFASVASLRWCSPSRRNRRSR